MVISNVTHCDDLKRIRVYEMYFFVKFYVLTKWMIP